jgi:hypothetical protein
LPLGLRGFGVNPVHPDGDIHYRRQSGEQVRRLEHHRAFGIGALNRVPSSVIAPGDISFSPAVMASTLDLPQPEWPISDTNPPYFSTRLKSSSAAWDSLEANGQTVDRGVGPGAIIGHPVNEIGRRRAVAIRIEAELLHCGLALGNQRPGGQFANIGAVNRLGDLIKSGIRLGLADLTPAAHLGQIPHRIRVIGGRSRYSGRTC